MNSIRIGLCIATLIALVCSVRADGRMLFRDRFEPDDGLQMMELEGASLGLEGQIRIDRMRWFTGISSLQMGGVAHELRAKHSFTRPTDRHSASVFVYVDDDHQPQAFLEVGLEEGEPLQIGVTEDRHLLLRGAAVGEVPRVNFEPGWVELTLHRDAKQLRVFAAKVVVAQWQDTRHWTDVAVVRAGSAEEVAWFDDLRVYTGPPDFQVRIARNESRRGRSPQLGFRVGATPILDPSSIDPGVNFEVDYSLRVRPGLRLGVEGAFQSGSILEDTNPLADILLLGFLAEHQIRGTDVLLRAEIGFGRLDDGVGSQFGWYGATIGYRIPIAPRLEVVPTVGVRRLETNTAVSQIPVALTLRWANEVAGSKPTRLD